MLKYIGQGSLAEVPARDLTDEEVELYGGEKVLIGSGLYERVKAQEPAVKLKKLEDEGV